MAFGASYQVRVGVDNVHVVERVARVLALLTLPKDVIDKSELAEGSNLFRKQLACRCSAANSWP